MKFINMLVINFNTVLKYMKYLGIYDNIKSTKIASDNRFVVRYGIKD